ncbi:hypothetical protein [Flavobacterium sp.]|uniref:hypothetical protein n=1 Tax=Flavobacterium sp. TaxID=239 RepID=UPI003265AE56
MTEEQYFAKKKEVISKFTEDRMINVDATTNKIIECLIRDVNPYVLIEQLLEINIQQQKTISDLIVYAPLSKFLTKE